MGIADGAKGNWEFLERHTDVQVIDFWHAAEYLGKAAAVLYRGHPRDAEGVAGRRVPSAEARARGGRRGSEAVEVAGEGATVGEGSRGCAAGDHVLREPVEGGPDGLRRRGWRANEPIGSGVTEAACKVIVKQRLCGSGMKWTESGAAAVLSLRCLSYTPGRWDQFWAKIDRWGFPVAA